MSCSVAIIYAIVISVVTSFISKALKEHFEDNTSVNSDHKACIRSCVIKPSSTKLDDVGGHEQVKEKLRKLVLMPLKHPTLFYEGPSALRPPKGILLHGPPGTGKTMLAKALASESGANFIALTSATLENKWWGESSKLVKCAFDLARTELQPCIVFFDEIDGLGRSRNDQDQSSVYSLKVELLRNMDGVHNENETAAMTVLACTNCITSLDPALRRRFQLSIHVSNPTNSERLDILKKLTAHELLESDPTFTYKLHDKEITTTILTHCSELTHGFSGSDLSALYALASSIRFQEIDMQSVIDGGIQSGTELMSKGGAIRMDHWIQAINEYKTSR